MKLFMKSLMVCCLAVASVLSWPLPEDASTTEAAEATTTTESDGGTKNPTEGETSTPASEQSTEASGKDDRQGTYNKVSELLDKDTDVHKIGNPFLRAFLDNNLQSHLRVPVVNVIGLVGNFPKIAGCFASMGPDVKKIIDEKLTSFTTCKSDKGASDSKCSEDGSTGGQFDQITAKVKDCVMAKMKAK